MSCHSSAGNILILYMSSYRVFHELRHRTLLCIYSLEKCTLHCKSAYNRSLSKSKELPQESESPVLEKSWLEVQLVQEGVGEDRITCSVKARHINLSSLYPPPKLIKSHMCIRKNYYVLHDTRLSVLYEFIPRYYEMCWGHSILHMFYIPLTYIAWHICSRQELWTQTNSRC
jgi:hypothetical protein